MGRRAALLVLMGILVLAFVVAGQVSQGMAMASATVKPEGWPAFYEDALKQLKPGLTYLIVHLGYNDAELQAVMSEQAPFGAAWRQRDFDVLTSPCFARAIKDNGVTLVGWKDLKNLMK